MPGSLRAQREPGAGGRPAQAGGAEVGSPGLWGVSEGRGQGGGAIRRKDQGDLALTPPTGLNPQDHPPCQVGRSGHLTAEDTEAQEEKGLGQVTLLFLHLLASPCGMSDLSSLARDWTQVPAVEAWSPNHWTSREFPRSPG